MHTYMKSVCEKIYIWRLLASYKVVILFGEKTFRINSTYKKYKISRYLKIDMYSSENNEK